MQLPLLSFPFHHHCSLTMSRIRAFPLLVLLFLVPFALFSVQGCPPHELKTLLRFKSTVNDTLGTLEFWTGHNCCDWDGVKCSGIRKGTHVSKLDLQDFGLKSERGEIDPSIFELKHLEYLDLRGNYFYGEIPSQLGKLSSLRHLHLDSDDSSCKYDFHLLKFSCNIQDILRISNLHWLSNLSSLEYLSLSVVAVKDKSWKSIIGSFLHLKHLDLSKCFLSAPTSPSTLPNLSSLTFLALSHNYFSDIPTWIKKLPSLTHLDISYNNMSRSISNTIRNLTGLEYLDLSYTALTGQIPLSLGHNHKQYGSLSHLNLEGNKLEGTIPSSLGLLTNLTLLCLGSNQLGGNIPFSLGNLSKLTKLILYHNQLSGSLPLSFVHLSSLTHLDVSDNRLNESIPSMFMLPSSLQTLYLSNNKMNGTITQDFFQKSFSLEEMYLSYSGLTINISSAWIPSFQLRTLLLKKCKIGGPIPSWISTQFSLDQLDLSATQLMGDLPSWLWDIDEVHLSDNHLQGSLTPTSGRLRYLDLSMNELSGHLPAEIHVSLSNAEVLILADNKFGGQIPTSIANCTNLSFLDMSSNRLTGNVPAALCNLTALQALNLENNSLDGEIPKELGSLSHLQSLRLGKNSLQGILPSSLKHLSGLQVFDVGANNLTGNISHWIADFSSLQVLVMRSNNFKGNLPSKIGGMPKLQVLDLSSNLFSGEIPHSYLGLQAMQNSSPDERLLAMYSKSFRYIEGIDINVMSKERHYQYVLSGLAFFDLSNNRLSGPLPAEVENLKGLIYLNLSMNNLSGSIPESLGNLLQLESVDLSFNNFSGRIPPEIGDLTYLAHLNLSYNNLFGMIPQQGGQMITFDASSYMGNPNLWGCPLKGNCSRPVARASPSPVGVEEKGEEGFEFPWYWMCFGLSVGMGFSGMVMVFVLKFSWRIKCFHEMDRMIEMIDRVICMLLRLSLCGCEGISPSC